MLKIAGRDSFQITRVIGNFKILYTFKVNYPGENPFIVQFCVFLIKINTTQKQTLNEQKDNLILVLPSKITNTTALYNLLNVIKNEKSLRGTLKRNTFYF